MRSRYTAYVLADIDYLMASHHPKTRPVKERKNILRWTKSLQWLQLKILDKRAGNINDKEGWVEFKAVFIENGLPQDIHENSYFIKEYGKWYYLSGEHK